MDEATPIAMVEPVKHGLMAAFPDVEHPSSVYGFDQQYLEIPARHDNARDSAYGMVMSGALEVNSGERTFKVTAGEYFSISFPREIKLVAETDDTKAIIAVRHDFKAFYHHGGPVEKFGRLKYIDGCTDSLLIGPPLKGDPCLNLLRFPKGIDQTAHTHPTIRAGIILEGAGVCRTARGDKDLLPGSAFILYPDAIHAFSTLDTDGMKLMVFHPDTDTGPSHEDHPMLNRTIVDGVSAAEIDDIRTKELER